MTSYEENCVCRGAKDRLREVRYVKVPYVRAATPDREDGTHEPCDRLSHPDHQDRVEDRISKPHDEVDLVYADEVGYHYAGNVHESRDDVLEGFVVSVQC